MGRRRHKTSAGVWMRRKEDGQAMSRARKRARLTQRDLAYLCRVSQTTIYLLEKPGPAGMSTCSDDLALRIADRLHVDVEDLFEERAHPAIAVVTTGNAAAGAVA